MIYKDIDIFLLQNILIFIKNNDKYKIKQIDDNTFNINVPNDIINKTINNIIIYFNKLKIFLNQNYKDKNNKIKFIYDKDILNIIIHYLNQNNDIIYNVSKVYYYDLFLNINNNKFELSIRHKNKDIIIINVLNHLIDIIIFDFNNLLIK